MPAVINIATSSILGASMALVARRSPALRQEVASWPLFLLLAYQALVFTPVATYLFRFHSQWSMLYLLDPQIYPQLDGWIGWLSAAAVLLNGCAALLGYLVARSGILSDQPLVASLPILAGVVAVGIVALAYGERLIFIGDYDEFWQGNARLFVEHTAGWVGLGAHLVAIVFVLWVSIRFGKRDPALL